MCQIFILSNKPEPLHYFLTLEWCLKDWAEYCVYLHVNRLEWRDDCIINIFYHFKGYQEGVNCNNP